MNLTNKIIGFGSLKFLIPASSILFEKKIGTEEELIGDDYD